MATKQTVSHVINTQNFDTTDSVSICAQYAIGPFTIRFTVSHNFWTKCTSLHTISVDHAHFVVETLCTRKVQTN